MVNTILGTDTLEKRFGRVHPLILFQSPSERISLMLAKNRKIVAYNVVHFEETNYFPKIYAEIMNGNSIGKTLRKHGVDIERVEKCAFRYNFPKKLQNIFDCHDCNGIVKYVELLTRLTNKYQFKYATIIEIYSPSVEFSISKSNEGLIRIVKSILSDHFKRNDHEQNN